MGLCDIPNRIVERDLNPRLEQVHLAHDGVEESHDVDSAVLISVELQEGRSAEKVPALLIANYGTLIGSIDAIVKNEL